jgi:hypothetical protein
MAIQLPPEALINPDAPPIQDMIDAIQNLYSDYRNMWGIEPRYLYINDICWADCMFGLLYTVDVWGLEVVTHPDMPYMAAALHHDYLPAREVALRTKRQVGDGEGDLEEAIDRGQLILG